MDQEKAGLFSLLLQNAYEEAIQVDVVKIKRKKVVLRLKVLKEALEHKDYEKANFILLDICDKILNDPFSDEYNMTSVQVDMIVFSSAVLNVSIKYYDRTQQIITALIMKYRNPIFYYVLGVSHFYRLSFQDAKEQFKVVINLLGNQKNANATFPWPDTNVLIISITAEKIRENALCFLDLITLVQNIKPITKKSSRRNKQTTIEISSSYQNTLDLNVGIGTYIQNDIYPLIQVALSDLIKFDKRRLPSHYQKILLTVEKPVLGKSESNPAINEKKAVAQPNDESSQTVRNEKEILSSDIKTKENVAQTTELQTSTENKVADEKGKADPTKTTNASCECKTTATGNHINITKKNQLVQVQPLNKCKQVQTFTRTASQYVQTIEANIELIEKNRIILEQEEIIASLKAKVFQLIQKQKETEAKLKKNNSKDTAGAFEKDQRIREQQEIIDDLKLKLEDSMLKRKNVEKKLNETNSKTNEANQTLLAETENYKKNITELRNYNQVLEKSATNIRKERDEIRSTYKTIFRKYKDLYSMQIIFYENFQTRCENVLAVLNNISGYLTEITVPTREDCQTSISEWLSAMLACTSALQTSKKHFKKYEKVLTDETLFDIAHIPPLMPMKEPNDILLENIPILIYTIKDFETMLQNNHRMKKEKNATSRTDVGRNNINGGIDYKKKSNFIHKGEQPTISTARDNIVFGFEKLGTFPDPKNSQGQPGVDCSTSKSAEHFDTSSKKTRILISYLKKKIPYRTEEEITEALSEYRKSNNGSLSGITINFILYNVLSILESPEKAWTTVKESYQELNSGDEETCPICIEPIRIKQKSVLTCKHAYHTECIREWLTRNRACAVCRMYTVLDDEFPPLKT